MITDRNIMWKRGRLWLPSSVFQNGSIAANNPLTEITWNSTGRKLQGTLWDGSGTTGFTSSQSLYGCIPIPKDFNPQFPLGFQLKFIPAVSASSTNAIQWSVGLALSVEGASTLAMSSFAAVNTNFTSQALLGRGVIHKTSRAIKNEHWATRTQIFSGLLMEFEIKIAAITGYAIDTTNKLWLFGMEIDYMPMLTRFPHSEIDGPVDDAL